MKRTTVVEQYRAVVGIILKRLKIGNRFNRHDGRVQAQRRRGVQFVNCYGESLRIGKAATVGCANSHGIRAWTVRFRSGPGNRSGS